jgi:stalled ribosome alternative rescue factor ArfA
MRPPVLCAPAKGVAKQNAVARIAADKMLRQYVERSCRNRA